MLKHASLKFRIVNTGASNFTSQCHQLRLKCNVPQCKSEVCKIPEPPVWEYINPDQEKSNSLCCSIVNRLIQLWLSKGQVDQRFWGPGPSEPSQTDVGLSCSQPDVKVCEHGHQYWRQFHASLTLWPSNSLLILVDRDTAEGIPAISPSSWYFIRFFLSPFVHLTF